MRIFRVFPRKNNATPNDELVHVGFPDLFSGQIECDEVHISVTFTEDVEKAKRMFDAWSKIHKSVKIGGPAFDDPGGEFVPGLYLKPGMIFTSRGCPNHCWFCSVPGREGVIRELKINPGNNILDSNLLACSMVHQERVFDMLSKQNKVKFTGGLEASRFTEWHAKKMSEMNLNIAYFAYDTEDDRYEINRVANMLKELGVLTRRKFACYCLIGYKNDTLEKAKERLDFIVSCGMTPTAMLWNRKNQERKWRELQRHFFRPTIIFSKRGT